LKFSAEIKAKSEIAKTIDIFACLTNSNKGEFPHCAYVLVGKIMDRILR
jgi:hypothetical protein